MRPDFFILGAPKCGTTSLAEWLKESPHVFVSTPKEPNFFAPDVIPSVYRTVEQYERLFDGATPAHRAIGEASTVYLQSAVAVPRILAYRPDARFIVMLRSPIEMAVSLHGQMLYSLNEDIASFEDAWDAQEARARGERIPDRCRSPVFLQYGEACRLGSHVERLFRTVDRESVEIVFLEDMRRDAESAVGRCHSRLLS